MVMRGQCLKLMQDPLVWYSDFQIGVLGNVEEAVFWLLQWLGSTTGIWQERPGKPAT